MARTPDTAETTKTTLIVGGNGKTGSRGGARLPARGVPSGRASRPSPPAFDWNDEGTWAAALDGMGAAYLPSPPALALPSAAEHVRRFARRAVDGGVEKLVL